jgi:integrase/recombinase XerC/integrase/recombinase XerD
MANELIKTDQAGALSVPDLIAEWLQYEAARGASDTTLSAYKKSIEIFRDWVLSNGLIDPGIVKPSDIRAYKSALAEQYAPQTVNLRLSGVRSFFRFLVNTDKLLSNPAADVRGVKRSKTKRHKREELTSEEVRAVLATCKGQSAQDKRDLAILTLMAYCGLRSVEINRADLINLKTDNDRLVLEVQGKGYQEADEIVIIPRDQEQVIHAWIAERKEISQSGPLFISLSNRTKGQRLSLRAIRYMAKERYQAAGVVGDKKSTHSLRHSAITNAIRNGASPMQVQAMARHASFDTTLGYIHSVNRIDNPAEDFIKYMRA